MNFDLTEDEEMLKAVAERFVADRYDLDRRRQYLANAAGFSRENWILLGELGLIAAPFDSANGGLGIGPTGLATIFEALGRGLVVEPLAECAVLAGGLFETLASDALKANWMPDLIVGKKRLVLAHREHASRNNASRVETTARVNGRGVYLTGTKSLVPSGGTATAFLVSARVDGGVMEREGVAVFLVDARAAGLAITPWRLIDGTVAVSIKLDNVHVDQLSCLGGDCGAIERAQSRASLVSAAEALGIMERLFAETLEYLRTRQQFGTPLGKFQALQHRMVAQYAVIEQARALLDFAMMDGSAGAIDGARAFVADVSVSLGHEMIQMHGGMGVTDELSIGHGHKRLVMLSRWPDDADTALDRYAACYREGGGRRATSDNAS